MTEPCAARFCPSTMALGSDWLQLDIPDHRFLAFCSLKCLIRWADDQKNPMYRIPTQFVEAHGR